MKPSLPEPATGVLLGTWGATRVYTSEAGDRPKLFWTGKADIDADGSPHAYHPQSHLGLDLLQNAKDGDKWVGVVTDGEGRPVVQGAGDPAPGFYVSTTSLQNAGFGERDPRRYVDSEKVSYIVIPRDLAHLVKLGSSATVSCKGRSVAAIVADYGPRHSIGEISICCAEALGIASDPRSGGVPSGVSYQVFA